MREFIMNKCPSVGTRSLRTASLIFCAAALAACSSTDATSLRTGPQATHPASTTTPSRANRHSMSRAQAVSQTNAMFDQYCLSGRSNTAIERTVRRSKDFKPAKEIKTTRARIVFYLRSDGIRGGITFIYSATGGLRCSVSVETARATLYTNGRIIRPRT